jgi:mRNA interferase RelE/StbE
VPFNVLYHPDVRKDLAQINGNMKKRLKNAVETRLIVAPQQYGEPLRKTLKGYWKMRVGDYRIVFKTTGDEIMIYGILNRKTVYEQISKRF